MIFKIICNAVGVVIFAAAVGALVDPAIVRAAVDHITGCLHELVDIGERLGHSDTGRQIAGQVAGVAEGLA